MIDQDSLRSEATRLLDLSSRQIEEEVVYRALLRNAESRAANEALTLLDQQLLEGVSSRRKNP